MTGLWTHTDRDAAYTEVCESLTAAGPRGETLFLARLCLLLAEELADPVAFARALSAARFDSDDETDVPAS
jgi:hypothetical protein